MKLISFSVSNYKVFTNNFTIDFAKDSIAILTGKNNTGKSTILEAINCFFQKETKAKTIPNDCFSKKEKPIVMKAVFETESEKITIVKKYKSENAPSFYDEADVEIKNNHNLKEKLEELLGNKPFYITPSMLPDDINGLIQEIYSEIIKNDLRKIEKFESESDENEQMRQLSAEYAKIKKSYPEFLRKLKLSTDKTLELVSRDVSNNLKTLFSNDHLSLSVVGGESAGFSSADILKSTNSSVHISSNKQPNMPLANQGTGLQRMSLIYLIQNLIEKKFMGDSDNKLLLIDEPEAFLHPEAVRALSRSLYKIGSRMPLMISTHSPILIDLSEGHTSIQVFRVGEQEAIELYKSVNHQFDEDDIKNIKILNYADSYVNEFFFADKILIVEGDTEYIAFKHLAKSQSKNIHIIRARGKATIGTLMKILNQFNASYDILHDADNHEKYALQTLRAQLTNCKNLLKLKTHEKTRIFCSISNFEQAIGIGDVDSSKKTETIYQILHADDNLKYIEARKKVENLFEQLINPSSENSLIGDFSIINSEQDYEDLFKNVIENKSEKS